MLNFAQQYPQHALAFKILHTADWHLGRSLNNFDLLEDQAYVLKQIVDYAAVERPDVVILAGDIFDRSVAPVAAVKLFGEVARQIVSDLGIPLVAIAGNHDNAERVEYFAPLLASQQLYLVGHLPNNFEPLTIGKANIFAVPYLEPFSYRNYVPDSTAQTFGDVYADIVKRQKPFLTEDTINIFVGHAFIQGGSTSESERIIAVGGAENVPATLFQEFDYAAFGHLHGEQQFLNGKVRYSGSPLKYSASEEKHRKSVTSIEFADDKTFISKDLPLLPLRDLLHVTGTINESLEFVLDKEERQPNKLDFLRVTLRNASSIPNVMGIVQKQFPNTFRIDTAEMLNVKKTGNRPDASQIEQMSTEELFGLFYEHCTNEKISESMKQALKKVSV